MAKKKKVKLKDAAAGKPRGSTRIFLFVIIALAALLAFFLLTGRQEEQKIVLADQRGNLQVSPGTVLTVEGGAVKLSGGQGNYVIVPVSVDADIYDTVVLELKQTEAYGEGRLFFISPYNKQFDLNYSCAYDTGRAGRFNRIYVNLRKYGAWQGMIKGLLVIGPKNSSACYIRSLNFIQASPWSKVRAWLCDFTRYSDPLLGTCFAMASPYFIGGPFNLIFIPFLWLALLLTAATYAIRRNIKVIWAFGLIFIFLWSLLELSTDTYYFKAIGRNANLYWGKPTAEKRGIVVGDREFVDFVRFCDEVIPLDARICNLIPKELPGTPFQYLSATQFFYQLRPRQGDWKMFTDRLPPAYYVLFRPRTLDLTGVAAEQSKTEGFLQLAPRETMAQEVMLGVETTDLTNLKIGFVGDDRKLSALKITLADKGGTREVAVASLLKAASGEAIYQIKAHPGYQSQYVRIVISNEGATPIGLAISKNDQYKFGRLFYQNRLQKGDLMFSLDWAVKNAKLFKRYKQDGYIYTK